jgi:hypothetical protein
MTNIINLISNQILLNFQFILQLTVYDKNDHNELMDSQIPAPNPLMDPPPAPASAEQVYVPTTPIVPPPKNKPNIFLIILPFITLIIGAGLGFGYAKITQPKILDTTINRIAVLTPTPTLLPSPSFTPTPVASASPTPTPIPSMPILSTTNWKKVGLHEIVFYIPLEATCNSTGTCQTITYTSTASGKLVTQKISMSVDPYSGGTIKNSFLAKYKELNTCEPVSAEAKFGNVIGVLIAVNQAKCRGNNGGIAVVIANKLVTIMGNLNYDPKTMAISHWDIRDTIVSTIQAGEGLAVP